MTSATTELVAEPNPTTARLRVETAFSTCCDPAERAQCALTLLAEELEASRGYLCALQGDQLRVIAAPDDEPKPPAVLMRSMMTLVTEHFAQDDAATVTAAMRDLEPLDVDCVEAEGRHYRLIALRGVDDDGPLLGGVAALEVEGPDIVAAPSWGLVCALTEQLARDVDSEMDQ